MNQVSPDPSSLRRGGNARLVNVRMHVQVIREHVDLQLYEKIMLMFLSVAANLSTTCILSKSRDKNVSLDQPGWARPTLAHP